MSNLESAKELENRNWKWEIGNHKTNMSKRNGKAARKMNIGNIGK